MDATHTPETLLASTLSEQTTALSALTVLTEFGRAVTDLTEVYVRRARRHGDSWHSIGQALGVTTQAAQQRFGK
jgi:hypothetical protein